MDSQPPMRPVPTGVAALEDSVTGFRFVTKPLWGGARCRDPGEFSVDGGEAGRAADAVGGFQDRELQSRLQAAASGGAEGQVAAMFTRRGAGDRETDADTAGAAIARTFDAIERREHLFALAGWDSRTVILDGDDGAAGRTIQRHTGGVAIFDGVVDKIGDGARDRD